MYINEADKQAISKSIELLESKSSAELVAVVTKKSATYKYESSVISIIMVCFISLICLYFDISTLFLMQIQILLFLVLHFIFDKFESLVLFLLPSFYKKSIASKYANIQFANLKLNRTKTKHALMFFVSIDEKYVEIITDENISVNISNDYWQEIVDEFIKDVKNGDLSGGYLKAINTCSIYLIKEFPIKDDDENELPNEVIELI
ncbi:TPM domain-containing protein [Poseidonibacter antarcticus]|uniref:TPM domain-containing protein n=1 Tax=Poseidonibacter antarcticus TaxID=2478538 RepID=UPI000EF4B181|nr:TPM domain-containing protein [Poseidonibacter antarcticus]